MISSGNRCNDDCRGDVFTHGARLICMFDAHPLFVLALPAERKYAQKREKIRLKVKIRNAFEIRPESMISPQLRAGPSHEDYLA